jgi:Protein of unknown function (DUF3293)
MSIFELPSDDPWSGYARLTVAIRRPDLGDLAVQPARRGEAGRWPWPTADPVAVLTAWDPGDARPGLEVNRRRQSELEDDLGARGAGLWSAEGMDPVTGARDEGVAVRGVLESVVLELGAHYGQDAVFVWTPDEWAIVACVGGRRVASGWRLVP